MSSLKFSATDLVGLPPELTDQLSAKRSDKANGTVLQAIKNSGGVAHVDKILIQIYRDTGEVWQKINLIHRCHRMNKKGLIAAVCGKRGFYEVAK